MCKSEVVGIITFSVWVSGFFCNGSHASILHFLGAYYSFITLHDASHKVSSVWFGRLCAIPLGIPFDEFSILHRRHHRFVNDKVLDPDYVMQELHPIFWLFAPEIYLYHFTSRKIGLGRRERTGGIIRYGLIIASYVILFFTLGFEWVIVHLLGPSRLAFMLLVYLLDVLPHRNLGEGETRDLWSEKTAPLWLQVLTQKQCYHNRHHARPYIRTLEL